jgi:tetratricopeptide (TPR) repeat protein
MTHQQLGSLNSLISQKTIRTGTALLLTMVALSGCRSANSRKLAYLESGKRYEREGKMREAAIQFANAVRIDSSFLEGHYELSKAYTQTGSTRLAIYELSRVLQLDPGNLQARLEISKLFLQIGQVDVAATQAAWVAGKMPMSAEAQAVNSAALAAIGKQAEAIRFIRSAIALEPNRSEYHAALGTLLAADPKTQQNADAELQTAIRLDSKNLTARNELARLLERRGDLHGAEEQMRLAISLEPKSVEARANLAALYLRTKDTARAEETLRQATDDLADDPAAATLLQSFYQQTGQSDHALQTYEMLVHRHPSSLSLQLAYIRVLIDRGAYDKVRPLIQDLSQKHGTDPGVILLQAYVLMHDGQDGAAMDLLQTAAKSEPDNAEIAVLLGTEQQRSGDFQRAKDTFGSALLIDPQNLNAQRGLADLAYRKGDLSGLREAARLMLIRHPGLADGYLWRGIANLRDHQIPQAVADLEEAKRRDPNNAIATVQLGKAVAAQGNTQKARALFEEALQARPDAEAIAELTQMDVQGNHAAAAVTRAQQQLQRTPNSSELYDQLAQAQLAAKDLTGAAASASRALELDASNRSAMQTFTQAKLSAGQLEPAMDAWRRWAEQHPVDPQAPSAMGMLYEAAGDTKDAAEYYRKSLAIEPNQPEVSARVAALMAAEGGNLDVALSMAQAAYRAQPASAGVADSVGWIYYLKGLPASALPPLQNATKIESDDASSQYHLGVVQARLGNKAEALTHLRLAQQLAAGTYLAANVQTELAKLQ